MTESGDPAESAPGALPREVRDTLVRLASGPRGAAWVRFGDDGVVAELGGALAELGLGAARRGARLDAAASWLEGLDALPASPLALPALDLGPRHGGRHVDVHVWRAAGEPPAGYLLVTDSLERVHERAEALARASEASLLREQLAGAERGRRGDRAEIVEALSALGAELLVRGPDGRYRAPGAPPPWLRALCGAGPGEEAAVDTSDPTSFLGAFLADAAAAEPSPGLVRSGPWSEDIDGSEVVFEAVAMTLSTGRRVVMVEHLDQRNRERQELLQRAREASLSHEAARRDVEHKDVLLNCIVHDLRAPLASIRGALQLLGAGLGEQRGARANVQELLALATRQTERQEELVRAVLEVFRAELLDLERFEVDPRTAPDLAQAARDAVSRAAPAFEALGVGLRGPGPAAPVPVVGTRDRLDRVLDNLLDNARRHAPAGTAVEVAVDLGSGGAELTVADRGPGVPEVLRGALFQRFVRGTAGGAAGLGLYYCRMTVERWGGAIRYRDRPGGGAEFHVRLRPLAAVSSPPPR